MAGAPANGYPDPTGDGPSHRGSAGPFPGSDSMNQGRITWGRTGPAGTGPAGTGPAETAPARANQAKANPAGPHPAGPNARTGPAGGNPTRTTPFASPRPAGPAGNRPVGAGADSGVTDVLPPVLPDSPAPPTRAFPATATGPAGNRPVGAGVDADVTDVLPPVLPDSPASPTRAFPATATAHASAPATAVLRDPWQETPDDETDAGSGDHTHDPHEVTVQLDAVQLGDGVIRRAESGQHRKGGPEPSDGPVFVDASGRRSRLYRRLGIAVGVACAIYAVVIVSTLLSGNSDAPWLPVEGQQEGKPAGQVDTTPLPSESAQPSGTGSAAPRTSPSAGTGVTTAPGEDAAVPGTSGTAQQPGTSAGPDASETGTAGTGAQPDDGASDPDPTRSTQLPPSASPDPSVPAGGGDPTVDPTAPTVDPTSGTDPAGDDTTANGVSDPLSAAGSADASVVAAEAAGSDHASTSSSLSPESAL
ncbi:hypothetical protein ACVV2G_11640 [Streptomyces ziwulingensis]